MSLGGTIPSHKLISKNDMDNAQINLKRYLDKDMTYWMRPTDSGYGVIQLEENLAGPHVASYANSNSIVRANSTLNNSSFVPLTFSEGSNLSSSGFTRIIDNNSWRYDGLEDAFVLWQFNIGDLIGPPQTLDIELAVFVNGVDTGNRARAITDAFGTVGGFDFSFVFLVKPKDELRIHGKVQIASATIGINYTSTLQRL